MSSSILIDAILKDYGEQLGRKWDEEKDIIFQFFAAEQLLKHKDLDEQEIKSGLIGGGFDNGIDGYFIFVD